MAEADESSMQTSSDLIRWRRWLPLVIVAVTIAITLVLDNSFKRGPFEAFAPDDASMVLSTSDFGATWAGIVATETWQGVKKEQPDPLIEPLVQLRKKLGVRMSPERWNAWMGPRAALVQREGQWRLSTCPGVLMRVAAWVHGITSEPVGESIFEYRGLAYQWQGSTLHVSSEVAALTGPISAGQQSISLPETKDGVRIHLPGRRNLSLMIQARDGLPTQGSIDLETTSAKGRPSVQQVSGTQRGLVEIAGGNPLDWMPFLDELLPDWPTTTYMRAVVASCGTTAPFTNSRSVWVLEEFDEEPIYAMPIFTHVAPRVDSEPLNESTHVERQVYRQGSWVGWREPWFGHRYERITAQNDDLQLLTNSVHAMGGNAYRWTVGAIEDHDLRVVTRVPELFSALKTTVTRAAELDAIEGWDSKDVEELLSRIEGHLTHLGKIELNGMVDGEQVTFEGYLDAPDE